MWSAVIFVIAGSALNRVSNSNVECWFSIVKNDVLEGHRNLKVGRFIRKMKNRIEIITKEIAYKIDNPKKQTE